LKCIIFQTLESLGKPHVESFDWALKDGMKLALKNLEPQLFELPNGARYSFKFMVLPEFKKIMML
jgi:hypothetical protein